MTTLTFFIGEQNVNTIGTLQKEIGSPYLKKAETFSFWMTIGILPYVRSELACGIIYIHLVIKGLVLPEDSLIPPSPFPSFLIPSIPLPLILHSLHPLSPLPFSFPSSSLLLPFSFPSPSLLLSFLFPSLSAAISVNLFNTLPCCILHSEIRHPPWLGFWLRDWSERNHAATPLVNSRYN